MGRVQDITSKTASVTAVAAGTYVGQLTGGGFAVRVGSEMIYNAVYAQTCASGCFGWMVAPIAANSAVGAAAPQLLVAGTVAGGVIGGVATTVVLYAGWKVASFTADQISGLFNKAVKHEALTTEEPMLKETAAAEEAEVENQALNKRPNSLEEDFWAKAPVNQEGYLAL